MDVSGVERWTWMERGVHKACTGLPDMMIMVWARSCTICTQCCTASLTWRLGLPREQVTCSQTDTNKRDGKRDTTWCTQMHVVQ